MRYRHALLALAAWGICWAGCERHPASPGPKPAPRPEVVGPRSASAQVYTHGVTEKMPLFRRLRGRLEIVVLGDSRHECGVDPSHFTTDGNAEIPKAFNMAVTSGGLMMVDLLVKGYLVHVPRLRWVLLGISPRIFSEYFDNVRGRELQESAGYLYDQKHGVAPWEPGSGPFSLKDLGDARLSPWGWVDKTRKDEWNSQVSDPASIKRQTEAALRVAGRGGKWSADAWKTFDAIVSGLTSRNVKVLAFIAPMHRYLAEIPVADDDGTSDGDYAHMVIQLEQYQKTHSGFFFRDFHQDGNNPFEDEDYWNFDHLSGQGAKRLTLLLDEAIRECDSSDRR